MSRIHPFLASVVGRFYRTSEIQEAALLVAHDAERELLATIGPKAYAARVTDVMKDYGITLEMALALLVKQDGLCWFCHAPITHWDNNGDDRHAVIHHDHDTLLVLGIAHNDCNILDGKICSAARTSGLTKREYLAALTVAAQKEEDMPVIYPVLTEAINPAQKGA